MDILNSVSDKKNKNIILNVIAAFLVKGGSMIVSLFTLPAYIRYFNDQTVLGVWLTLLSVLNWVLSFDLGIGNGLRNHLTIAITENKQDDVKKYISSAYMMIGIFSAAIIIAAKIIFPYINWNAIFAVPENYISCRTMKKAVEIVFTGLMLQFFLRLINSVLYALQLSSVNNALALLSNIIILLAINIIPHTNAETDLLRLAYVNILAVNIPLVIATIIVFFSKLKDCKPRLLYYKKEYARTILGMGIVFFVLQFASVLIGNTNEFLISHFCQVSDVVEYQPYYKLTNVCITIFGLAMTPIWSAVTKGMANKDFLWIRRLYTSLLGLAIVAGVAMMGLVPLLPYIVKVWLGDGYVIKTGYTILFVIYSAFAIWNSVNSTIANGLGVLKAQAIFLTFGAILNIPLSYILAVATNSWIGIVCANIISYIPVCIIQPVYLWRFLKTQNNMGKDVV